MQIQKKLPKEEVDPSQPGAPLRVVRGIQSGHEVLETTSIEMRKEIGITFLLAHPDDEVGHLVSLQLLQELGFQVSVDWLTNGDGSTSPDIKKMESMRVLKEIGVERFHFMDNSVHDLIDEVFRGDHEMRDGRLEQLLDQVRDRIRSADIIITNAFEGGHILHDLTNLLVRAAVDQEGQTVLEIPQYSLKTVKEIAKSFFRACIHRCLGKKVFYNVGNFREEFDERKLLLTTKKEGDLTFPSRIMLNDTGVANKGAQYASYRSQWEEVFAPLLDVVEFNGTESFELFRRAGAIPSMWSTVMHLEKWVLSLFSSIISPKKIYQVMEVLKNMKKRIKSSAEQVPKGLE
jgi:LmbE family N-acetylglucosaminyl deacetylase